MIIWKDIPVPIYHKVTHVKRIRGRLYRSFIPDHGDLPVIRFNEKTQKFEEVINNRGRAYAARKRLKYRKKRR